MRVAESEWCRGRSGARVAAIGVAGLVLLIFGLNALAPSPSVVAGQVATALLAASILAYLLLLR